MKQAACATTRRVLIVDDHGTSRQFMFSALLRSDVSLRQARSANEARRLALGWLPHVILLDIRLGDGDGYATARQIREHWPPDQLLPRFVMISADPPEDPSWQALAARGDQFLLKPFTALQLMDAVSESGRTPPAAADGETSAAEEMQSLFRDELASQVGVLDHCLGLPDFPAAREILHQLIASSALCGQRRLETDLRSLYAACHQPIDASALARSYFALLLSSHDYLDAP